MAAFDDIAEKIGHRPFDPSRGSREVWEAMVEQAAQKAGMVPPVSMVRPEPHAPSAAAPSMESLRREPPAGSPQDVLLRAQARRLKFKAPGYTFGDPPAVPPVFDDDGSGFTRPDAPEAPPARDPLFAGLETRTPLPSSGPDRSAAKAVLAKALGTKGYSYPGLSENDIATAGDAPKGAGRAPAAPRSLEVAQTSPKVAGDSTDAALEAAQKRGGGFGPSPDILAALTDQLESASDIMAGTRHSTGAAGASIRDQAARPAKDLLTRRGEERAQADQGIQQAAEGRSATAFGEAQALNDPNSRQTKAIRAQAVALYPQVVAKIPPAEFAQMSGNDLKTLMGELPQKAPGGGGAKAPSSTQLLAISKRLPPETVNVYNGTQRIKSLAQAAGGWDKIGGVGALGGLIPGLALDKNQQAFRQEIGNIVATYLKAGGGKNITAGEERILIEKIAADPMSVRITPEQLQRGIDIIERSQAGNVRQSMGLVPEALQQQLFQDVGLPMEWVRQDLARPTGAPPAPQRFRLPDGREVEASD